VEGGTQTALGGKKIGHSMVTMKGSHLRRIKKGRVYRAITQAIMRHVVMQKPSKNTTIKTHKA